MKPSTKEWHKNMRQMILRMLGRRTNSAYDFKRDGVYYMITSMARLEVEVVNPNGEYARTSYSGSIVIPESVSHEGKTFVVARIGNYAFFNGADIKSVAMPGTIRDIGKYACAGCRKLDEVDLPESLEEIGYRAFHLCTSLRKVVIPATVTAIRSDAFGGCGQMKEMFFLPQKRPNIGEGAFMDTHAHMEQYVPNKAEYGFGVEYLSFPASTYKETGAPHHIAWENNLKAYTCDIAETDCQTETNAGVYDKTLNATYRNGVDFTVGIPYHYEIK